MQEESKIREALEGMFKELFLLAKNAIHELSKNTLIIKSYCRLQKEIIMENWCMEAKIMHLLNCTDSMGKGMSRSDKNVNILLC